MFTENTWGKEEIKTNVKRFGTKVKWMKTQFIKTCAIVKAIPRG